MAGLLYLKPGARPLGLTKHGNIYESLHRPPREPSPSVFASPKGSSSDEEFDGPGQPDKVTSDNSEFVGSEQKEEPNRFRTLRTRTGSSSVVREDGKKRELSVEPSNIRASSFTSGKGPGSRNGSQGSQKRKNADLEDDDLPTSFSQRKRPRQSYGYGSMTKQKASVTKPSNSNKSSSKASGKAGPVYKDPAYDATMAQVDRCGWSPKPEELKQPAYKATSSTQTSMRDQRASQRSIKSTQESSQKSAKAFKQPPRPSPKKVQAYRNNPIFGKEIDLPGATRSSRPAKEPAVTTKAQVLKASKFQNALNTVTDKLGVSDMQINLPSSATHDSSAPPTSLDAATTASSPLSSLGDYFLSSSEEDVPIITSEDIPIYNAKPQPAVCPMCKQAVDQSFLEEHTKVGMRMSLRQQAQFCKAHKERSAESEWEERGYPNIDWQQLDNRVAKFHTAMDEMLSRRRFSFYRNAFEDSLKRGKNRTVQEALIGGDEIEGTSPGYYGGRGAKLMADNIMSRFARKLRRLAASDKLISSGGVSRYVQAVLVPELAVFLIMDDMKADEEGAREVLRDSVDIGNLLNDEEDEIITDPAPEERIVVDVT